MTTIQIGNRKVGQGQPVLVCAELSGEHRGDYARAEALVYAAKEAGADCIKVQMFEPSDLVYNGDHPALRLTWQGRERTLHELYSETATPMEWHWVLKALADKLGVLYIPSVFSQRAIDLAVSIGCPALKIASFELTDTNLVRAAAKTGLPLILSTGMATVDEMYDAALALSWLASLDFAWMLCVSAYPAPLAAANLRRLRTGLGLAGVRGLSDHTRSNTVVAAAVALGACVVERHLTLDRETGGPDAGHSDTPAEFAAMVRTVRDVEAALGTVHYGPTPSELPMLKLRRSCWVVQDVPAGGTLTPDNVRVLRPNAGLPPSEYDAVLGKRAKMAILAGTPLSWEMIEA